MARAIYAFHPALIVVTLPGSALRLAALALELRVAQEAFADRAYQADGSLVPRGKPGALIRDPEEIAARALRMITRGEVETEDGRCLPLKPDTLCIHGDTPGAVSIAARLRRALEDAGVTVAPLSTFLHRS